MSDQKTWYVGKGKVTDEDVAVAWGVDLGADEWQFSDGPVGSRGSSEDFPTLEAGIAALSPCIIIMEKEPEMISPISDYNFEQELDHAIFCKLLEPVKVWLEGGAKHAKGKGFGFNMSFANRENDVDYDYNSCGTAMCIGGAMDQFNGLGVAERFAGDVYILRKIQEKFETIGKDVDDLFYPNKNDDFNYAMREVTPKMALQAIANFEKYGNANWQTVHPE